MPDAADTVQTNHSLDEQKSLNWKRLIAFYMLALASGILVVWGGTYYVAQAGAWYFDSRDVGRPALDWALYNMGAVKIASRLIVAVGLAYLAVATVMFARAVRHFPTFAKPDWARYWTRSWVVFLGFWFFACTSCSAYTFLMIWLFE